MYPFDNPKSINTKCQEAKKISKFEDYKMCSKSTLMNLKKEELIDLCYELYNNWKSCDNNYRKLWKDYLERIK